jgi:hypothetical protein
MIEWFDRHLKDRNDPFLNRPTVRYYVMGAVGEKNAPGNVWRTVTDWPVKSAPTPFYFHAGGKLSTAQPASGESVSTWNADPLNPAKIPARGFPGARDARGFEKQKNVLTFTTDVLTKPVEWTGDMTADLHVQSSAKDTDFIVRVTDVYPDGRSILIVDMIRRARYRDGYTKEVFMRPGNVYRVKFRVGSLSQIFNRGHRIRVTLASTGAPFYEPNPNTGEPLTIEFPKHTVVARNTVHHDRRYASHVIAPVRTAANGPR